MSHFTACTLQTIGPQHNPNEGRTIINANFACIEDNIHHVLTGTTASGLTQTLAQTLAYGNTSSGNDVVLTSGDIIVSSSGLATLDLRPFSDDEFILGTDGKALGLDSAALYGFKSTGMQMIYSLSNSYNNAFGVGVYAEGATITQHGGKEVVVIDNTSLNAESSIYNTKPVFIGATNSMINVGVTNAVVIATAGITANTSNTLYTQNARLAENGGIIYSGGTPLENMFTLATNELWSGSTGTGSIIANNGTGNLAESINNFVAGRANKIYNGAVASYYSNIPGGYENIISGAASTTIIGGRKNKAYATYSLMGGYANTINKLSAGNPWQNMIIWGAYNTINVYGSASNQLIVGGSNHTITNARGAIIGGGYSNTIFNNTSNGAEYSIIGGGKNNYIGDITNITKYSTIGGGHNNTIGGATNTIAGGFFNSITSDFSNGGQENAIGGGYTNKIIGTISFGARGTVIGGGVFNTAKDTRDAVIVGGSRNYLNGQYTFIGGGYSNMITGSSSYSIVVGGRHNHILNTSIHGVIVGGSGNTIDNVIRSSIGGGYANKIAKNGGLGSYDDSTIGGGHQNYLRNTTEGFIGGGRGNYLYGSNNSSIVGGTDNLLKSANSFIGGGRGNAITAGTTSTIVGGAYNSVDGFYATIGGGSYNTIQVISNQSTIGGGKSNTISGSTYSTIGGGQSNMIERNGWSFIAGGYSNKILDSSGLGLNYSSSIIGGGSNNVDISSYANIGGGKNNSITGSTYANIGGGLSNDIKSSQNSVIGGGINNTIEANSWSSVIAGGNGNSVSNYYSNIGGGIANKASGYGSVIGGGGSNSATTYYSTVGGGFSNLASGNRSTIGGGQSNTASGSFSTIGGGQSNTSSGNHSGIFGGSGNTIDAASTTSVILGGFDQTLYSANTAMVPNLVINHGLSIPSDNITDTGNTTVNLTIDDFYVRALTTSGNTTYRLPNHPSGSHQIREGQMLIIHLGDSTGTVSILCGILGGIAEPGSGTDRDEIELTGPNSNVTLYYDSGLGQWVVTSVTGTAAYISNL